VTLRPHVRTLAGAIADVRAHGDGLAVLTTHGLELLDRELVPVGSIAASGERATRLCALADGRFVACDPDFGVTKIIVGRPGGAFASVLGDGDYASRVHPTSVGFIAPARDRCWLDVAGDGRWIDADSGYGSANANDRVVVTSTNGVATILSARGEVIARRAFERMAKPLVIGSHIWLLRDSTTTIVALDDLTDVTRRVGIEHAVPFGDDVLAWDDDVVTCTNVAEVIRWDIEIPQATTPRVLGDRIAVGSWKQPRAWIVDRDGALLAELVLPGTLAAAARLGDGIALSVHGSPDVMWWRDGDVTALDHDVAAPPLFELPFGTAAAVDRHLLVWRTDRQGPDAAPVATAMPFGAPLVVNEQIVTPIAAKRFFVAARTSSGEYTTIAADARWRPALTRDDARTLVHDAGLNLDELAFALGMSRRAIVAARRAGTFPLVPPHELAGYDYLGAFETTGALVIADPCYMKRRPKANESMSLAIRTDAAPGTWYAYARDGSGDASHARCTAELVAIHADGFATFAAELLGTIGVDAGCAGVFDRACPEPNRDGSLEEGICDGKGALAFSGFGDGFYAVYAGRANRRIVKLRVVFFDEAEPDRSVVTPKTGRAYSPKQRFAVGDAIAHPTFGTGTVTDVRSDGKISVAFADGARLLVHAR
jgi:hypothetical protein